MGFGVKAAVFPFHSWLPDAGVAPTPVTALLHAVAVVKAGAFAVLRVTYYIFGTAMLYGTWAQMVTMGVSLVGIVYASTMSIKEPHLKRRCAYSTMSNLNYILFGCTLMCPAGFYASLAHMITHAIMKITAFFCVGAIMHQADKHYIYDVDGLAKKMPVTFACFTISGLALAGVTGLCGFSSKWYLLNAAAETGMDHILAIVGIAVLLYSSLATLIYMMTVSARAYLPTNHHDERWMERVTDPDWWMKVPFIVLCTAMVVFGLFSNPLISWINTIGV
mgnify:CR=1 FL=1